MYLLRLDDASEYMDAEKWKRMEDLLDKYGIKPIFGIIPANADSDLLAYGKVENAWTWMKNWVKKGWTPALHGYTHVFETENGGINPVNNRSEFAGVALEEQKHKIRNGYQKLKDLGFEPDIFFAPAHTFDENTLLALEQETSIRVISDTIANDVYYREPFFFIPQQSGRVRKLPLKMVTFCYHPNIMTDEHFQELDHFLRENAIRFMDLSQIEFTKKNKSVFDCGLEVFYFAKRFLKAIYQMRSRKQN